MNSKDYIYSSINELLIKRAQSLSDKVAIRYLVNEEVVSSYTYSELQRKASQIAKSLQENEVGKGERVLLVYPPGIEFVLAFLGCLFAGVVAVPTVPPNKHIKRMERIISDCRPKAILSTNKMSRMIKAKMGNTLCQMKYIMSDENLPDPLAEVVIPSADDIAFLQYTSGSTSNPKGVMVTHGNIINNSALLQDFSQNDEDTIIVTWLPIFHDMGLIAGILQPLYVGGTCIAMSPTEFLQNPVNWLKAITKYKGTFSGAPDFAYALCSKKISDEEKKMLDLSSWKHAFSSSDTIRYNTLQEFKEKFEQCGFSNRSFSPAYGLAEATLVVTSYPSWNGDGVMNIEKEIVEGLETYLNIEKQDVVKVPCGVAGKDMQVRIVNPSSFDECLDMVVGEIWVSGPCIAKGYWENDIETERTFNAYTSNKLGPCLRTGDLGYLKDNKLYFVGRMKDVIIVRGKTLYPQDIEEVIEGLHYAIVQNGCATFTVEIDEKDEVIAVLEIYRKAKKLVDITEIAKKIKSEIIEEFGINIHEIVFIEEGTINKTTSGKIQRSKCKQNYENNKLTILS